MILLGFLGAVGEACGFASEELLAHLPIVGKVEALAQRSTSINSFARSFFGSIASERW